jgi:hypothetical protein
MKPLRLVKAEAEAVDRLVDLIKEHNKWVEPEADLCCDGKTKS